jgi:uncharacterized FlgJ-related protein
MKTLKNFTIIGIAIIISAAINFFIITSLPKSERVYTQIMFDINDSFTEEKVKIYLKELNIKYPEVALAQMKLESANGTSKVFKENNNLFGMKLPKFRPTTALGEKNNHSYYSHWRQSVVDYAIWQSFIMNPENVASEKNWIEYLNRMYAEDGSYGEKILLIRNKIKSSE